MQLIAQAAIVLLAAACATAVPRLSPAAGALPDLRGTWSGTWGGTPLALRVLEQGGHGGSSLEVGPWPLFETGLEGVSGTMTYTSAGEALSVGVRGRLGEAGGRLTLVIEPVQTDAPTLVLTVAGPDRLEGTGVSRLAWHPQGQVELSRGRAGS